MLRRNGCALRQTTTLDWKSRGKIWKAYDLTNTSPDFSLSLSGECYFEDKIQVQTLCFLFRRLNLLRKYRKNSVHATRMTSRSSDTYLQRSENTR